MLRAPAAPGSVRVGAPRARGVRTALASLRLRAGRARCLPARCAQEGVGTQLAGGAQLDAAAAAVAAIRSKLPYIDARELVGDNVKYSFVTPLVTLTGAGDYLRVMSHWRQTVPDRLGVGWKVRHPRRAFCAAAAPGPRGSRAWSAHPKMRHTCVAACALTRALPGRRSGRSCASSSQTHARWLCGGA